MCAQTGGENGDQGDINRQEATAKMWHELEKDVSEGKPPSSAGRAAAPQDVRRTSLLVGFDGACNSFALMLLLLVLAGLSSSEARRQVAGAGTSYQHGNKVGT
jgi:hypothetical protein